MDILTVILLLVVIILLFTNKTSVNQKFYDLEYQINELKNLLKHREGNSKTTEPVKETVVKPAPVQPPPVNIPAPPKQPDEVKPAPVVERHPEAIADSLSQIRKPVKSYEPAPKIEE